MGTPYGHGKYAVLEVDKDGYLRVKLPAGGAAISAAPSIEDLLSQLVSLNRRILLGMEMQLGTEIPDPL